MPTVSRMSATVRKSPYCAAVAVTALTDWELPAGVVPSVSGVVARARLAYLRKLAISPMCLGMVTFWPSLMSGR